MYSKYPIEFQSNPFTPSDLIKKLDIKYSLNNENKNLNEISNYEKIKLKLSMYEIKEIIGNKEKIYIFNYPESLLTSFEIKQLKKLLEELSTNGDVVLVATNSKFLLGNNLDSINFIQDGKLLNFDKNDVLKEKYLENYPKLEEWSFIEKRLLYLIKNYILENFEEIGIPYELDLIYDEHCVFFNYINKNFNRQKNMI